MWSIGSSPIPRTAAEEAYFSHWLGIGIRCWRTEAGLLIYHNSNKQSNICKPHAFGVRSTRPGPVTLTCCSMGGISSPNGRTLTTMFHIYRQRQEKATGLQSRQLQENWRQRLVLCPRSWTMTSLCAMIWIGPTHSPRTSHIWPDLRYVPGFLISVNRFAQLDRSSCFRWIVSNQIHLIDSYHCMIPNAVHLPFTSTLLHRTSPPNAGPHRSISVDLIGI
jgi:hypothetical protein